MPTRRQFLRTSTAFPALLAGAPSAFAAPEQYDILIRGGRVLDAAQRMDKIADVAISGGQIAEVRPNIAPSSAREVIEAAGKLVTPGLIDIHLHVDKDMPGYCLKSGVTAFVDGGSKGADNADDFVKMAKGAPNHMRMLLNIARTGTTGPGELQDLKNADPEACRRVIEEQRDILVGIKARLSRNVAGDHDLEALRLARKAADPLKVPIMVHIGDTASPLPDILALLRPGDIITHVYAPPPHSILGDNNKVLPQVREARKRGILFDIGHGRLGHITWEMADRAMQQDFLPDTISTDLTGIGRTDGVFDLPTVMSKFLLLGMPLGQVMACATANAAHAMPAFKSYGSLRRGAPADVSVFDLLEGNFEFVDTLNAKRIGRKKLVAYAVVIGGKRAA